MDKTIPGDLPARWRERAETLRSFGDPNSARLWDKVLLVLSNPYAPRGELHKAVDDYFGRDKEG